MREDGHTTLDKPQLSKTLIVTIYPSGKVGAVVDPHDGRPPMSRTCSYEDDNERNYDSAVAWAKELLL